MKKIIVLFLLLGFTANYCYASNLNEIMYGIRGGIDILSDVNRLRGQVNQTNAQQQQTKEQQLPETSQTSFPSVDTNYYYTPPQQQNNISTKKEEINTEKILIPIFNNETGLYGYQTPQGQMVIQPQFEDAKIFSEGLAAVYNGKRWGYINAKGEYVIPPKFGGYSGDEEIIVNPFINGTAAVYLGDDNANGFADIKEKQYALINKNGEVIKYYDLIFPNWYGYSQGNVGEYQVVIGEASYIIDSQGNILKIFNE